MREFARRQEIQDGTSSGDCTGSRCGSSSRRRWEIVRENTTHMSQLGKTMLRVALRALAVLMVPLVASRVVEGWNWDAGGFVFVYLVFFGTGMVYAMIARQMGAWLAKAA